MKRRLSSKKNKATKANITLRRKLVLVYKRATFIVKVGLIIFVYLLCFTNYLPSLKFYLINNVYNLTSRVGFVLENVIIEGEQNLEEDAVLKLLNAAKDTPIFSINLSDVRNKLMKNRWIKEVSVARRLPNTIHIKLLERKPIAIWQINNRLFLIDNEGFEITRDIGAFTHLLHVVGVGANIYASKFIEVLEKKPVLMGNALSAIRYGDRRWDLNLKGKITVKLPEENFENALEYLSKLNKAGKLFNQNYKIIDLRDRGKYYIEKYE